MTLADPTELTLEKYELFESLILPARQSGRPLCEFDAGVTSHSVRVSQWLRLAIVAA
jgi:hypothetical protein